MKLDRKWKTQFPGIIFPDNCFDLIDDYSKGILKNLLYFPTDNDSEPPSIVWAKKLLSTAEQKAPSTYVPIMPVDDRSLACVVCKNRHQDEIDFGKVVRWHLDDIPEHAQGQIIDIDVKSYLDTMTTDLKCQEAGIEKIERIISEFNKSHGVDDGSRSFEVRPIRLAVQNVIVGQAAYHYDRNSDALSVSVWQAIQAPHLASHEAARGLAALTLVEAFRNGSTMEIRFNKHPEKTVPASLCQYGRTRGLKLGVEVPGSISPSEARGLMWAVTSMPNGLRELLEQACQLGAFSPERACYSLLSGTWSPVALDYMMAVGRTVALRVLSGGSHPTAWWEHRLEMRLARRAFLIDRFLRRVTEVPEEGKERVIAFEDDRSSRSWQVEGKTERVIITAKGCHVPWLIGSYPLDRAVLLPRDFVETQEVMEVVDRKSDNDGRLLVFVIPQDVPVPREPCERVKFARAPWTLDAIDREVRQRFIRMAIARK